MNLFHQETILKFTKEFLFDIQQYQGYEYDFARASDRTIEMMDGRIV